MESWDTDWRALRRRYFTSRKYLEGTQGDLYKVLHENWKELEAHLKLYPGNRACAPHLPPEPVKPSLGGGMRGLASQAYGKASGASPVMIERLQASHEHDGYC